MVKLQKLWAVTPLKPIASRKPTFLKTVDLLIVCFVSDPLMWIMDWKTNLVKWELYPVYQLFRSGLFVAFFGFFVVLFQSSDWIVWLNWKTQSRYSGDPMSHGKHLGIYIEFGHLRTTDDVFFWVFEPVQTKIAGIAAQCQKPFLNMYLESIKRYITKKTNHLFRRSLPFAKTTSTAIWIWRTELLREEVERLKKENAELKEAS